MGKVIQVPDEEFVRKALIGAEDTLLARTGRRFSLMLDRADEAGFAISLKRDDGAEAGFITPLPWSFTTTPREQVNAWVQGEIDKVVEHAIGSHEAEPEPEQRYAVAIVFGGRPDIVMTPERGVPADEAVRVYGAFLAGAAAIGGRPAMLPLGA